FILDVSPDLAQRQQERLAPFANHVQWLDSLPQDFEGCIIANEVLDAMPVSLFEWGDDENLYELHVINRDDKHRDTQALPEDSDNAPPPDANNDTSPPASGFEFLRVPASPA